MPNFWHPRVKTLVLPEPIILAVGYTGFMYIIDCSLVCVFLKVLESNEESGSLILTIVVSGHFFISQRRAVQVGFQFHVLKYISQLKLVISLGSFVLPQFNEVCY